MVGRLHAECVRALCGGGGSRLPALRRAMQHLCVETCADYSRALTLSRLTVSLLPTSPVPPGGPEGAPASAG
jgi:hypothetical protein